MRLNHGRMWFCRTNCFIKYMDMKEQEEEVNNTNAESEKKSDAGGTNGGVSGGINASSVTGSAAAGPVLTGVGTGVSTTKTSGSQKTHSETSQDGYTITDGGSHSESNGKSENEQRSFIDQDVVKTIPENMRSSLDWIGMNGMEAAARKLFGGDADPEKLERQNKSIERRRRQHELIEGLRVLSDIGTAFGGGNVYKREKPDYGQYEKEKDKAKGAYDAAMEKIYGAMTKDKDLMTNIYNKYLDAAKVTRSNSSNEQVVNSDHDQVTTSHNNSKTDSKQSSSQTSTTNSAEQSYAVGGGSGSGGDGKAGFNSITSVVKDKNGNAYQAMTYTYNWNDATRRKDAINACGAYMSKNVSKGNQALMYAARELTRNGITSGDLYNVYNIDKNGKKKENTMLEENLGLVARFLADGNYVNADEEVKQKLMTIRENIVFDCALHNKHTYQRLREAGNFKSIGENTYTETWDYGYRDDENNGQRFYLGR